METNVIIQGDCLNELPKIEAGSVDLILCDPPYETTCCDWDKMIPLEPMWKELKRIIKPNGAIVMTASQPFTSVLISSNLKMFRYSLVWEKSKAGGFLNAKRMPLQSHEDIVIFYNKLPTYNPQMQDGKPYKKKAITNGDEGCYGKFNREGVTKVNEGSRYPRSVLRFANPNNNSLHPTQKPVALMEYLIRTYTNPGELVLDFTFGSGTTLVAAKNTGRRYIGIEISEAYCKIAEERLAQSVLNFN